MNTNQEKEEKLRKRREQLAAWRQKKEREEKEKQNPKEVQTSDSSSSKADAMRARIEEWKRKKAAAKVVEKKSITSIAIKRRAPKPLPVAKKRVFDDFKEEPIRKKVLFKQPRADFNLPDEGDDLDAYLERMQEYDTQKENDQIESDQDSDSEIDERNVDSEQQQLLSSKLSKVNQTKELGHIDHSAIEYEPFRKDFYREPIDISHLSPEEVELIRLELGGIRVKGTNCPKPVTKWAQLGLPSVILDTIQEKLGYKSPSPIQAQALPAIMSGRDLIGIAKTGSGKTLAFVVPVLRQIMDQRPLRQGDGPIGLILTPTRELAIQIHKEASVFAKRVGFSACCCYGGSSIEGQIAELKRGAELIIGTPGRVIDLLAANSGRVTNLQRVTYVVLDEADRMFDMGFEPQVTKIFSQVRTTKQTVLFSATFPRKMELLAKKVLVDPVQVTVGGISVVAAEIEQKLELVQGYDDKLGRLLSILHDYTTNDPNGKILVFVERKDAADDLLVKLISNQLPCLAIHGDKDQVDRRQAIKDFSSPKSGYNILIATSIAARGLDVKGLNLVVNFDSPSHVEDYVHRVGRTGRAGRKGTAITFLTSDEERAISDLVRAVRNSVGSTESVPPELIAISDNFIKRVKSGKEHVGSGFGGRGLDNLQEIRENNKDLQKRVYGEEPSKSQKVDNEIESKLPTFDIIEGKAPESTGPDKCKFHSRVVVNDLPQTARWNVMQRESLGKIIEATGTSITNKGQYYGPKVRVSGKKLYLLVEGLTEKAVKSANDMLRDRMIEGLEMAAGERGGKYTV